MLKMSTARSTTQASEASRRGSVQKPQGLISVREPQISHRVTRSRAVTMVSARCWAVAVSAWTRCKAIRSAERGPMPGSLLSAATRAEIGSGSTAAGGSHQPGNPHASGHLAHLRIGNLLGLAQRLVCRAEDHVLE